MFQNVFPGLVGLVCLSACLAPAPDASKPTGWAYTPPEASGLVAVRPYPNANDICQVIGPNAVTEKYIADGRLLIGCPHYETGAIEDRLKSGKAERLERIGEWLLISTPHV